MGAVSQLTQLFLNIVGGSNPSAAASASGDIGQMIKWLTANVATSASSPIQSQPWLPGRRTAPIDVTISGSTTLTERFNYFNNLTINASQTLTGLAGGCVIVVEGTLALGAGAIIDFNGLGGAGGASGSGASTGGGPFWADKLVSTSCGPNYWYRNPLVSSGAPSNDVAYYNSGTAAYHTVVCMDQLSCMMGNGGNGAYGAGGAPGMGGSWPGSGLPPSGWALFQMVLMGMFGRTAANYGGGGGGGGASGTNFSTTTSYGGTFGTRQQVFGSDGEGAQGASGFGGGGGGGNANTSGGTGGAGGAGGGVCLILCKTLNNAGTIRANGVNGSNSSAGTNAGGGGGGGGGAVMVGYETLTAAGTITANAGNGGTKRGTGTNGAAGGAGLAESFKIRSGV